MISSAVDIARRKPALVPALRVDCVSDRWGFTTLRPQWNELLRASSANGPFLTWEWLHTWWQHVGSNQQLRILAVRSAHELVAVAPLTLSEGQYGVFQRLDLLGTGHAGSDYLDFIVRTGREQEAVAAIVRFLKHERLTLRLDHLPSTSISSTIATQLESDGWLVDRAPGGVCPIIPLAGHTWESFLASLGPSHRANVRRRIKQLGEKFDMTFERVTTDADRREALAALATWHGPRFADRGGSTAFTTPELQEFHDDATRRMLHRGWLRMYVLRVDNKPAAVMYGFFYNRQFYFYQHGFDSQYRQHSVGLVLMALSVRAAIEEGADTFDMLWGTESYKSLWAQDRRLLQQIHLFPPHLNGRLHWQALQARRRLGRVARRVLRVREVVRGT